ncbi:peptidylprolyl isomerase [Rickettsiaceae bacterium]|nr:peptidylprolyl isomerase [Rickettsiaceae bacterium]
MQKLLITFFSLLFFSANSLAEVVATYSEGDVTSDQIMKQFGPLLEMQPESKGKKFSELDKTIKENLIRGYASQKLFEKESVKLGIQKSEEFKEKLKALEAQLVQRELIERYLTTAVTEKMINDEYKKLQDKLKGQKEIKVIHILVDTEEKAKEIRKKLSKGGNFSSLAQEFSKDEGSKANGGELGYAIKGQFVPEFESKAFSMKKGEISDPVKTQFGWHIIKLLDSRDAKIPPKDQAKAGIKNSLSQKAVDDYISKLIEKGNIKLKI